MMMGFSARARAGKNRESHQSARARATPAISQEFAEPRAPRASGMLGDERERRVRPLVSATPSGQMRAQWAALKGREAPRTGVA
jgi:hypothetical protein